MVPIRFAEIKSSPNSDSKFQALPRVAGEQYYGPDFFSQAEAAWFNCCVYRRLGIDKPTYEPLAAQELAGESNAARRDSVEKAALDFMRKCNLNPAAKTEMVSPAPAPAPNLATPAQTQASTQTPAMVGGKKGK